MTMVVRSQAGAHAREQRTNPTVTAFQPLEAPPRLIPAAEPALMCTAVAVVTVVTGQGREQELGSSVPAK